MQKIGRTDERVVRGCRSLSHDCRVCTQVSTRVAFTGEISMLWHTVDRYRGNVIQFTIDPDQMLDMDTFELTGELADRYIDGVLAEGMRVRIECIIDTIEVVNFDTGETSDEDRPVVTDVMVLGS